MRLNPVSVATVSSVLLLSIVIHVNHARAADDDRRDPATREAQAARQEERQGKLKNNADAEQRERNKYTRCDMLSGDDRGYCIRRMNGEGTVTGSVESGGITRELTVVVPAK